jgi:hypothetical protein
MIALLRSAACLALITIFACPLGFAQSFSGDFDDKPWVEQQAQLPAFPKTENLLKIPMDSMSSFNVSIDSTSIDIGKDNVIRYVFVARSERGSENISFEGIRCETRERKLYAVGRPDKTWGQVRNAAWVTYGTNPRSYHFELAREYFCPESKSVMNVAGALKNLREGGVRAKSRSNILE